MELDSVDKILDFAIRKEEEAADFYIDLANRPESKDMKSVFLEFAGEEKGHKARLQAIKKGKMMLSAETKILDLKIGDSLVQVLPVGKIGYQQALILAMKAEKAAYKMYHDLASATDDSELKKTLLGLAQEEAQHKLRFEIEYDENILTEN